MRTIIFSDVHGNLPALEAMLAHAGPADRYVCLGDVVNYGPWSDACAERIAALPACDRLMGNHDQAFIDRRYPGEHPVARAFFDFCQPRFHSAHLLSSYRDNCEVGTFLAQHTLDGRYVYADTEVDCDRDYLIGHSHHPFARAINGHRLVNVGSVGQNRRNLRICSYAVHGPGPSDVQLFHTGYDVDLLISEMRRLGYPEICLNYYLGKLIESPQTSFFSP